MEKNNSNKEDIPKNLQSYYVEIITKEDGRRVMNRTNSGFNVFELIGILSIIQNDLYHCFDEAVKEPDEINRKVL